MPDTWGTFDTSPREAMNGLSYVFHRIGRCISSGGRRMERLALRERSVLKLPDVQGRMTRKGIFKETIKALRMLGEPNASTEEDSANYITMERLRSNQRAKLRVVHPHTKSTRAERRAAALNAEKAHKDSLRRIQLSDGSEANQSGSQLPEGR